MTTPKILLYLIRPGTPVPRTLAGRAPLLGRRAPVVGRRDRAALAGIGGGGIEATRAGAFFGDAVFRQVHWAFAVHFYRFHGRAH